jgi:6,7-dimethyl-8-ribityllumazine synthase
MAAQRDQHSATRQTSVSLPVIAIVVSRFNPSVTLRLQIGATRAYVQSGGAERDLIIIEAPGAYELPLLAHSAASMKHVRAVVALGCLIRGETRHDRYIAEAVAHGIMQVSLNTGKPVAFGVLTVENAEQANARSWVDHDESSPRQRKRKSNKGAEAMHAALDTLETLEHLGQGTVNVRTKRIMTDKALTNGRERLK